MKKGIYIMCPSGIEVIDTTIEAENRYEQSLYLEKRYARLAKKIKKEAKWYHKLLQVCGLL